MRVVLDEISVHIVSNGCFVQSVSLLELFERTFGSPQEMFS